MNKTKFTAKTMHNLIATNNGKFKSEKQAAYLKSLTEGDTIVTFGGTYNNTWTDFWHLDAEGITSWDRRMLSGKVVDKWNREGTTSTQVKQRASNDRHNSKVEQHKFNAEQAEIMYNDLCMSVFGYVICPEMMRNAYSAISISEHKSFIQVVREEFNIDLLSSSLSDADYKKLNSVAETYTQNEKIRADWDANFQIISNKVMRIRIAVQEKYPPIFCYNFM